MFIDLPKKAHNLAGRVFGQLRVLGPVEKKWYPKVTHIVWLCVCDCGNETRTTTGRLMNSVTKSCGCRRRKSMPGLKHGYAKTRTGAVAPEYRIWTHMIGRCHNPNDGAYADYGGRGIYVCDEWRGNFEAFLAHVGRRPSSALSIDRIDNNDGYRPGNVRWATRSEQNSNRRKYTNKGRTMIEYDGRTQSIANWARELGVPASRLALRKKRGWSTERILFDDRRVK